MIANLEEAAKQNFHVCFTASSTLPEDVIEEYGNLLRWFWGLQLPQSDGKIQ
ncbi:hypothetical protein [Hespellia stercorisuis]|uniref:hypothetical protein n=1 Tax=Hespellia stercorisuis TaxID=180311 RepID=UPI0013566A43|nr:hypothetical protein [Hespellia stercorisuis]